MSSLYTIIRYVNNQWSKENIAIGLLLISDNKLFFKISERKLKLVKNLNPDSYKLFSFSLNQLNSFVIKEKGQIFDSAQQSISIKKSLVDKNFISHLSQYNHGLIQFSEPAYIEKEFDSLLFQNYFERMIDSIEIKEKNKVETTEFGKKIEDKLYRPLRDKVDVNYKLKMGSLPSLYFDFQLDNIGVNGAIIASASLDLESHRIDHLQNKLRDYEIVIDRLERFAKGHDLKEDHSFYLIANPYKGSVSTNQDLDRILNRTSEFPFKRITTSKLSEIVKKVNEKGAHKFSEFIES